MYGVESFLAWRQRQFVMVNRTMDTDKPEIRFMVNNR